MTKRKRKIAGVMALGAMATLSFATPASAQTVTVSPTVAPTTTVSPTVVVNA